MDEIEEQQAVVVAEEPAQKKLKPARKQVKVGEIEKKEAVQTGKEYSGLRFFMHFLRFTFQYFLDIWYNKWAGGEREDNYSK